MSNLEFVALMAGAFAAVTREDCNEGSVERRSERPRWVVIITIASCWSRMSTAR